MSTSRDKFTTHHSDYDKVLHILNAKYANPFANRGCKTYI